MYVHGLQLSWILPAERLEFGASFGAITDPGGLGDIRKHTVGILLPPASVQGWGGALPPDSILVSPGTAVSCEQPVNRHRALRCFDNRHRQAVECSCRSQVGEDGLSAAGKGAAEKESNSRRAKLASAMGLPQVGARVAVRWRGGRGGRLCK